MVIDGGTKLEQFAALQTISLLENLPTHFYSQIQHPKLEETVQTRKIKLGPHQKDCWPRGLSKKT
jgi:hypothetical protein